MEKGDKANKVTVTKDVGGLSQNKDDTKTQEMFWINSLLGTLLMRDIDCKFGERISGLLSEYRIVFGHIPESWQRSLGMWLLLEKEVLGG